MSTASASNSGEDNKDNEDGLDSIVKKFTAKEVIDCKCKKCADLLEIEWLNLSLDEFFHVVRHNLPEYLLIIHMIYVMFTK